MWEPDKGSACAQAMAGQSTDQKVHFLIAGTQKGGTTALAAYLARHPEVFIPPAKEVHFFDNENLDWLEPDWSVYHQHFNAALNEQIWGEATPITMWWKPAIERLWRYNPHIRVIIILRNPITRAFSHWNMERQRGAESLDFFQALSEEPMRCRSALPLQHRVYSYMDRGFYVAQLREIWRFFPRHQVMVIRQEWLADAPEQTLADIERFLGLSLCPFAGELKVHQRTYENPMPEAAFELLRRTFWHEICQLQTLLGWDCADWLEGQ
jgi:hypothetical protein